MTIHLEEIVYLHCHQQGRDRRGRGAEVFLLDPLPAPTPLLPAQSQTNDVTSVSPIFPICKVGIQQYLLAGLWGSHDVC